MSDPSDRLVLSPLFHDGRVISALLIRHGEPRRQWRARLERLERQTLVQEQFARDVDDPLIRQRAVRIRELIGRSLDGDDFWREHVAWKDLYWPELVPAETVEGGA